MAYDADSIILDIMDNPKALVAIKPLMDQLQQTFGGGENTEAASEAISDEMTKAMIGYMPLRSLLSFGPMGLDQLDGIVAALNAAK